MRILYTTISNNTKSFLTRFAEFATEQVDLKCIDENTPAAEETQSFFVFVPTYLDGGNGIDTGVTETLTEHLREYIEYKDNGRLCLGVVGSGNKNFNEQYCLTAKKYAEQFNVPFIADFELRGTEKDVERIYTLLKDI